MKVYRFAAVAVLPVLLNTGALAQTNNQDRKDVDKQVKMQADADKAQAKADKDTHKALKSHKVKKAAKSQDKADTAADRANNPPQ